MIEKNILTVTQLNEYVKYMAESSPVLANVYVCGEISNFNCHYKTGHLYFTLKDSGGTVRAVMFRSDAAGLRFAPENGMRVVLHGRVSVFVRDGVYQIYVQSIEPDGVGSLYVAFEQLKARLSAEGLFDGSRKKPLPKYPACVGVITSPTGAAVRDIINILSRRFPCVKILLYPALVQGTGAARQLADGVLYFNRTKSADVVIIGRGGGSIEDLWAFNDEELARTIANSEIPIISAVGHETDFTVADFVSDRRAPTPSAAAELAVPDITELRRQLSDTGYTLSVLFMRGFDEKKQRLLSLAESRALTSPEYYLDDRRMELLSASEKLGAAFEICTVKKRHELASYAVKLEALSPLSVLGRGYAAVFAGDGTLVRSIKQLGCGTRFRLKMADGEAYGIITEKESVIDEKKSDL